ncbi:MAG: hypothetical protein RIC04_03530 [Parvibaculum sp.]|uniref:hypothetical protein n=1 Tax=Parvibaculum sp. TaxID=2024848 RepID=UPI0032EFA59E
MAHDKLDPTPSQLAYIEELKGKRSELQRKLAETQDLLSDVDKRLNAAAVLFSAPHSALKPEAVPEQFEMRSEDAEDSTDLTAAVERLANKAPSPLTKSNLRAQLRSAGFPENRLGNYFYTVIKRLKESRRISVQADGKIWKSPK